MNDPRPHHTHTVPQPSPHPLVGTGLRPGPHYLRQRPRLSLGSEGAPHFQWQIHTSAFLNHRTNGTPLLQGDHDYRLDSDHLFSSWRSLGDARPGSVATTFPPGHHALTRYALAWFRSVFKSFFPSAFCTRTVRESRQVHPTRHSIQNGRASPATFTRPCPTTPFSPSFPSSPPPPACFSSTQLWPVTLCSSRHGKEAQDWTTKQASVCSHALD